MQYFVKCAHCGCTDCHTFVGDAPIFEALVDDGCVTGLTLVHRVYANCKRCRNSHLRKDRSCVSQPCLTLPLLLLLDTPSNRAVLSVVLCLLSSGPDGESKRCGKCARGVTYDGTGSLPSVRVYPLAPPRLLQLRFKAGQYQRVITRCLYYRRCHLHHRPHPSSRVVFVQVPLYRRTSTVQR